VYIRAEMVPQKRSETSPQRRDTEDHQIHGIRFFRGFLLLHPGGCGRQDAQSREEKESEKGMFFDLSQSISYFSHLFFNSGYEVQGRLNKKVQYPMLLKTILLFLCTLSLWPGLAHSQQILKQFPAPNAEARGLGWDGQALWHIDATADKIFQLDPDDGQILSSINYILDYSYGGLTWGTDGYIWVTNFRSGYSWFEKVDPSTGEVVISFHCPGS
jgi:hypothetical protein